MRLRCLTRRRLRWLSAIVLPAGVLFASLVHSKAQNWDCGGYTKGTSGGPFLARVSCRRGDGTVIGVIGGWELGGDRASVSYSPRFFANIARLYQQAASGGPPS